MRISTNIGLLLALLLSCNESTTVPQDSGDGGTEPSGFLLGEVATGVGVIEIRSGRGLSWNAEARAASPDVYLVNKSDHAIREPIRLVVREVIPPTVAFANPDGLTVDGLAYKEFRDEVGADGLLVPGETSARDTLVLDGTADSLSVDLRLDFVVDGRGNIAGVVFNDLNGNGVREADEPGLESVVVRIRPSNRNDERLEGVTTTERTGYYSFSGLWANEYLITLYGASAVHQ